jgi:aminoglycoside 3-N-acetyltransferase
MRNITRQQQTCQEVQEAFARIDSDAVVLHTDLFRIRFVQRGIPLQQQLADLFQILAEASAGRTLMFPTFNYDFCRTRVYDPLVDPCQVGTLNEYVRQLYPGQRTLTPIFNFCIYNNRTFSLEPVENPFSEASTFAELAKHGAAVVFFGASFGANTFVHYVEEVIDVGYRYLKPFPGLIRRDDTEQQIAFRYRVRPLIEGAVDYDWNRLALDLLDNGVLHQSLLGSGKLLWFRADRLLEDWCMRLENDELYLLSATSRKKTQELYAQYGIPLRYEAVEHP